MRMTLQIYRLPALLCIYMALAFFSPIAFSEEVNKYVNGLASDPIHPNLDLSYTTDPTIRIATFTDKDERITIGPNLQRLSDQEGDWTINDAIRPELGAQFRDTSSNIFNYGITASPHWFRVKLKYQGTHESINREFSIEFPQLAEIDFHVLNESGDHRLVRGGAMRTNESKDIKSRHFIVNLHFSAGEAQWVYFKVVSRGPLIIPAYLTKPEFQFQQQRNQLIFYGAYYGIIIAMFAYNLFLFLWMRSTSYLFYIVYIASTGLALSIHDGILGAYLTDYSWASAPLMYFIGGLAIISLAQFCRLMLRTASRHKFVDKMLIVTISIGVFTNLLTITYFSLLSIFLIMFLLSFVGVTMLIAGFISVYSGYREGKFFCFAWSVFCLSLVIVALLYIGVVPFNAFTANVQYIGTAFEAVLLSFFLADRINTMTLEKLSAEQIAKKELELSLVNLDHSHQVRSEFFATVSHELRTPMNGVVGMLDLLSNTDLTKAQTTHIIAARKFAHLMMYFVDNLLGFSKKTDSRRLSLKPFQLRESLENTHLRFFSLCHNKGLSFNYKVADNIPNRLVGDYSLLQEVLNHLLDNAVKYTDSGSVKLDIKCQNYKKGNKGILLKILITDTGKGISKDKQKNIFSPTLETEEHSNSAQHKLGKGLSLCKRSADIMEADIRLKSKLNKGTEVQFNIPLDIDESDENQTEIYDQ